MIHAIVLLLAVLVAGSVPASADAAACIRRNGKLVLRDACKRSERPLDTALLNPVGPSGATGAIGEPGPFPLRIVDDADREVGPIQWFEFSSALVLVSHPALPSPVRFGVGPDGFRNIGDDGGAAVLYAEADCAGQPYHPETSVTYAHVEGTAAYRAVGGPVAVAIQSYETDSFVLCPVAGATDRGTCCFAFASNTEAVPLARIPLVDLGFAPPFRTVPR